MEKLTVEEEKVIEVNILKFIDSVCREYGIDYYIFYGSLLGAVRHQGFIPWDDDIDIVVPAERYKELCAVLSTRGEQYTVFSAETNKDYPYSFAKCVDTETLIYEKGLPSIKDLGIYVDIFPLYRCPKGKIRSRLFAKIKEVQRNLSWQGAMKEFGNPQPTSRKEKIVRMVVPFFKWRTINKRLANPKKCIIKNDDYSYCVGVSNSYGIFPKEWFIPKSLLNFEGNTFYAPGEYDKVLQLVYGDYMKYPPIEQRVYKHGFDAYRK